MFPVMGDKNLEFGPPVPDIDGFVPKPVHREDIVAAIEREPSFPLYYLPVSQREVIESIGYKPGRVVLGTGSGPEGLFRPDLYSVVAKSDVMHVHLYQPTDYGPPFKYNPQWKRMLPVLADIGPQIYAVQAGQWMAEVGFTPLDDQGRQASNAEARLNSVMRCAAFVEEWCGLAKALRFRAAIGLTKDQILLHAYWAERHIPGGDPLRKLIIKNGILVICYLAYAFWGVSNETMLALESDKEGWWCSREEIDEQPYERLKSWFKGMECWGGMDYMPGLRRGNDTRLRDGGFKAGVIGELPPPRPAPEVQPVPNPTSTTNPVVRESMRPTISRPRTVSLRRDRSRPGNRSARPFVATPGRPGWLIGR